MGLRPPELVEMARTVAYEYDDRELAALAGPAGLRGVDGELKNVIFAVCGHKPRTGEGDRVISFETSVRIERPVEEVFAFVSDPLLFPRWNSAARTVHGTSGETGGLGSTYSMERELRPVESRSNSRSSPASTPPSSASAQLRGLRLFVTATDSPRTALETVESPGTVLL
jgi:hypothetical protein